MRRNCNYTMPSCLCKSNANVADVTIDTESCDIDVKPIPNIIPNKCECGYDEDNNGLPQNPVLGQSYVPIQEFNKTFTCEKALEMGTLYPELVRPYSPGQGICEINKIKSLNRKGECNCGRM